MGQTIKFVCDCEYSKETTLGGGLCSNQEGMVRQIFNEGDLATFNKAQKDGSLSDFSVEYKPAVCPACQEIVALPVLYCRAGERIWSIKKACPVCGGAVRLYDDDLVICPKCNGSMAAKLIGYWD